MAMSSVCGFWGTLYRPIHCTTKATTTPTSELHYCGSPFYDCRQRAYRDVNNRRDELRVMHIQSSIIRLYVKLAIFRDILTSHRNL